MKNHSVLVALAVASLFGSSLASASALLGPLGDYHAGDTFPGVMVSQPHASGYLHAAFTQSFTWPTTEALGGFIIAGFWLSEWRETPLMVKAEILRIEMGQIIGQPVAEAVFTDTDLYGLEPGAMTIPIWGAGVMAEPVSLEAGIEYALRLTPNQRWVILANVPSSGEVIPTGYPGGRLLEGVYNGHVYEGGVLKPVAYNAASYPNIDLTFHLFAVPEPSSLILLGGGIVWLLQRRIKPQSLPYGSHM